jgi:hypothetical protein
MAKEMVRGYLVLQTLEFVRKHCPEGARAAIEGGLSAELKTSLSGLPPHGWFPRRHLVEVLNALVDTTSPERQHDQLVACGAFISERTANEFTSLVFGLLTPALFVQKVSRFWQREHQGLSQCEGLADVSAGTGSVRLTGVEGYDHIGAVWLGWMTWGLGQIRSSATITQEGWTPATPGPSSVLFQLRWS